MSRLTKRLECARAAGVVLALAAATPAAAAGPGAAASFAVLGNTTIYIDRTGIKGGGDVGGYAVELADDVSLKGSVVATGSYFGALELGDKSIIKGQCVTGGSAISTVPKNPAVCLGGTDTSGSSPLLADTTNAFADADALRASLSGMTPTLTLPEVDVVSGMNTLMTLPSGVNIVAVLGRFLVESGARFTLQAPKGSSVVFLVSGDLTLQTNARLKLSGGIKPDSVAYVVSGGVILGTQSSIAGTLLADNGSCLGYEQSKITGALLCHQGIAFSRNAKLTWDPLRASFP